jgi:hypothetical protein
MTARFLPAFLLYAASLENGDNLPKIGVELPLKSAA